MSDKFGKGLVNDIKREKIEAAEQKKLREKYDIPNQYVVVEKSNTGKFLINLIIRIVKGAATICILILAVIGLYTLIYGEIRQPFFKVITDTFMQLKILTN